MRPTRNTSPGSDTGRPPWRTPACSPSLRKPDRRPSVAGFQADGFDLETNTGTFLIWPGNKAIPLISQNRKAPLCTCPRSISVLFHCLTLDASPIQVLDNCFNDNCSSIFGWGARRDSGTVAQLALSRSSVLQFDLLTRRIPYADALGRWAGPIASGGDLAYTEPGRPAARTLGSLFSWPAVVSVHDERLTTFPNLKR